MLTELTINLRRYTLQPARKNPSDVALVPLFRGEKVIIVKNGAKIRDQLQKLSEVVCVGVEKDNVIICYDLATLPTSEKEHSVEKVTENVNIERQVSRVVKRFLLSGRVQELGRSVTSRIVTSIDKVIDDLLTLANVPEVYGRFVAEIEDVHIPRESHKSGFRVTVREVGNVNTVLDLLRGVSQILGLDKETIDKVWADYEKARELACEGKIDEANRLLAVVVEKVDALLRHVRPLARRLYEKLLEERRRMVEQALKKLGILPAERVGNRILFADGTILRIEKRKIHDDLAGEPVETTILTVEREGKHYTRYGKQLYEQATHLLQLLNEQQQQKETNKNKILAY